MAQAVLFPSNSRNPLLFDQVPLLEAILKICSGPFSPILFLVWPFLFTQNEMVKLFAFASQSLGFENLINFLLSPCTAFPLTPSTVANGLSVGKVARILSTAFMAGLALVPSNAT